MQIDWGWGAHQHYGREGQIKQSHSPYVSLSVSFTHTHKHTHLWTKGWGLDSCHNLSHTQSALSDSVTDQS